MKYKKQPKTLRYDRNNYIRVPKLRVIDSNGENLGVLSRDEALRRAREQELDLVLISPNEEVPVAKIIDWSKFKYLQSKKNKKQKKSLEIKEWQFKPKITERDIEIKLNKAKKYLKKGNKVKIIIKYWKRATYEDMYGTLNKILEMSEAFAEKVSDINKEGKNLSVFLKYKKNEKTTEEQEENA